MNSQRPAALADMSTIMAVRDGARSRTRVGQSASGSAATRSRAVDACRDIPGSHHRRRRRSDRARRAAGAVGVGARDRFSRPDQTSVGDRLDRLGCLGPVVRRASLDKKARRTASVRRAERTAAHRARHARRPALPYSGRNAGRVLRVGRAHPQVDGRRGDRRRRSARLQVLRQPRPAGLCRRHRKPGRPNRCERHRDRR